MEYYRGDILVNATWAATQWWQAIWDTSKKLVDSFGDSNWSDKFHTWRMDWTPESIKLYLDDDLLNTIELSKTNNGRGNVGNPFRTTSHYLLLNLAIGATNGGNPSKKPFHSRYEIDYVSVSQNKK